MTTPSQGPRRFRSLRRVLFVLGVVGALLVASRVSNMLFERPVPRSMVAGAGTAPEAPAPGGLPPDDVSVFHVTSAEGPVDAFREGRWMAVQKGDVLTRDDLVRTGPGAQAVLRVSAGAEVELREKVEIRLDRFSAAGATVDLRRGKVVARVTTTANDALAITVRETRTSNEGPAHFVVMADEHGQVAVATLKGAARFAAAGKSVKVTEGSQTVSRLGEPPDDPERIPEEVLLQVVWPPNEKHAELASVQGRVEQSSLVTVNGAPAVVGADGRFAAAVPLREGANVVEVQAEDLVGRRRRQAVTLLRRSARPLRLKPEPAQLWKK